MRAIAYDKTGQSSQAMQEMSRAVQLNPNDAGLQYQYGSMLFNSGDHGLRGRRARESGQLWTPETPRSRRPMPMPCCATPASSAALPRRTPTARPSRRRRRLVSADSSYDNLMLLGGAQLGAGSYGDASSTFQNAAGKNSRDWLPQYYIGQAQTAAGGYSEARRRCRRHSP